VSTSLPPLYSLLLCAERRLTRFPLGPLPFAPLSNVDSKGITQHKIIQYGEEQGYYTGEDGRTKAHVKKAVEVSLLFSFLARSCA
jgi:hypothetical protein